MPQHQPKFAPGSTITRKTSAAVTGGQLLVFTGDELVGPTAGAGPTAGVAAHDAPAGGTVTVYRGGTQALLVSGAALVANARVQAAAAGAVTVWAGAAPADVIGVVSRGAAVGQKALIDLTV